MLLYPSLGIQSYSQMMIRVWDHLLSIVCWCYHSQKVIGSLGLCLHPSQVFVFFFPRVSRLESCAQHRWMRRLALMGLDWKLQPLFTLPMEVLKWRPTVGCLEVSSQVYVEVCVCVSFLLNRPYLLTKKWCLNYLKLLVFGGGWFLLSFYLREISLHRVQIPWFDCKVIVQLFVKQTN